MRVNNKKIALTFGCFDYLHPAHLNTLKYAKKFCDILVVCVSTNDYIQKHKGHKAVIPLKMRMNIVKELRCVDIVDRQSLKFGKKEAIKKYKPSFLVVGSDHKSDYTGKGLGVRIKYAPYIKGISSTILKKNEKIRSDL